MLDTLVFIGRFQPLHLGHEKIIEEALQQCRKLIVLVGSSNRARSIDNPFNFEERAYMIGHSRKWALETERLQIVRLNDYLYNDPAWQANVQRIVEANAVGNVSIIGFDKDNSTYYLKMFPQWDSIVIPAQHATFNSTDIREAYFQFMPRIPSEGLSAVVSENLKQFIWTEQFKYICQEANAVHRIKAQWAGTPYEPTFNTVDNIVVQSAHILLVTRGEQPGLGLLALPGGYIKTKKTLLESAIDELKEETKIADGRGEIPRGVLKSFISKDDTFDDPKRDPRGRFITQAFLYNLPEKEELYTAIGSDDAAKADWYPIGTVPANRFYADHYFIMCKMLGLTME